LVHLKEFGPKMGIWQITNNHWFDSKCIISILDPRFQSLPLQLPKLNLKVHKFAIWGENTLSVTFWMFESPFFTILKFSIIVYCNWYVQMMKWDSCQEWTQTSKHYVKISWSNFWYSICYGLLKLYKNICPIKDKLNGLNTPWYNVLYE